MRTNDMITNCVCLFVWALSLSTDTSLWCERSLEPVNINRSASQPVFEVLLFAFKLVFAHGELI